MATARREATVAAARERVWELIEDPRLLPRWWPGVTRVEAVRVDGWTQVSTSRRGRAVRVDYRVIDSEPPSLRAWAQEIAGSPFERMLRESVIELRLQAVASGTLVAIAQRQKLRGHSRTGGLLLARATGKRLGEALDALARIC
ncbi:MAG: SRPBCC domain-containing protein [Solirubrobacteraceae bacterium]|jgi:uncharacterized protein YndB with AHSA1/START domain